MLASLPAGLAALAQVPAPPEKLSYQGFLVDAQGNPLGTPNPLNYDATFRIYDVSSGGNPLWTEQQTITVDQGYFSVLLGEVTASPSLATVIGGRPGSERYIGITIRGLPTGDGVEIAPRLQLLTSPYAFVARHAINADKAGALVQGDGSSFVTVDAAAGSSILRVAGRLEATRLGGSGAALTELNAGNITTGTLSVDRLPSIPTSKIGGSLLETQLPAAAARITAANTFSAKQTVNNDLQAHRLIGRGSIPVGGIIMWSGVVSDLEGSGFRLCDGHQVTLEFEDGRRQTISTPNLVDRFVMGARAFVIDERDKQGGSSEVTLQAANLPPHSHQYADRFYVESQTRPNPRDRHPEASGAFTVTAGLGSGSSDNNNDTIWYKNDTTSQTGGGQSFSILPSFHRLAYIIRYR
ncbi:MAG: hypothetical protein KF791_11415 [Verrucomicrobiae bacterium]|nr:hypothetical protein [Verrucomicrobiae bacterium]